MGKDKKLEFNLQRFSLKTEKETSTPSKSIKLNLKTEDNPSHKKEENSHK